MGMVCYSSTFKKIYMKEKNYKCFFTKSAIFCYIDDVIKQIINLSHNPKVKNSVENIGNNREIKIKELVSILPKVSNKNKLKLNFK